MLLRITALCMILFFSVGVFLSVAPFETEAGSRKSRKIRKKIKRHKKFSKRWWRAYHNRNRRQKTIQARKRKQRLRLMRLNTTKKLTLQNAVEKIKAAPQRTPVGDSFSLIEGKILKVSEGDTVSVENSDGKVFVIRMLGIDAPDLNQSFGEKSRKALSALILHKSATVIIRRRDSKNRFLGTLYCAGQDVNLFQLETGMAAFLEKDGLAPTAADRSIYQQAEQKAKINSLGLWRKQKVFNTLAVQK